MSAALEELADRLAVQDVMIRYATSCDRRDMDEYGACFTEDSVITGFGGTGGDILGRQAWVDYVAKALTRFTGTQHLLGNQRVWPTGVNAHQPVADAEQFPRVTQFARGIDRLRQPDLRARRVDTEH